MTECRLAELLASLGVATDLAAGLDMETSARATSGCAVTHCAAFKHWTFRDGKLVRWRGHEDTAATRDAFRR